MSCTLRAFVLPAASQTDVASLAAFGSSYYSALECQANAILVGQAITKVIMAKWIFVLANSGPLFNLLEVSIDIQGLSKGLAAARIEQHGGKCTWNDAPIANLSAIFLPVATSKQHSSGTSIGLPRSYLKCDTNSLKEICKQSDLRTS